MQNKNVCKNKIFLPCHRNVKQSDPGDFLKAQFVIFRCQKYVKKGYMEMRKRIYPVPLKSVLDRSIFHNCNNIFHVLQTEIDLSCYSQQFFAYFHNILRSSSKVLLEKKVILKILQISQKNTSVKVFFIKKLKPY